MLSVGSVCSGAGFMDLGFHRAGHRTVWFCEADPYRRRVLARHFPGVPIHHDLTELDPADLEPVDILIGGTPCPDWSNAGKRAGFNGSRASLFWDFARIRDSIRPEWTVWENVPGVFSQHGGRDFALVLGAFVGAPVTVPSGGWARAGVAVGPGGSAAWRLLNAQWFGVPQRRRRVFVVADLGGVRAEQVLFERAGGVRDSQACPEAGAEAAGCFGAGVAGTLGAHKSGGTDPTDLERGGASWSSRGMPRRGGGGAWMTTTPEQDILSSQQRSPAVDIPAPALPGDDERTTPISSLTHCEAGADGSQPSSERERDEPDAHEPRRTT